MTLITEYVNVTVFKEIHKMYPNAKVEVDYVFPETASILLPLVPGKLCFKAQVSICENPKGMQEIVALSLVTEPVKES
jgi:hypothetical protein